MNPKCIFTLLLLAGTAAAQDKVKCPQGDLDCRVQLSPLTVGVDGKTHYSSEFISAPVPLNARPVKVPAARLRSKESSQLVVRVTVKADGTTDNPKIVRSLGAYLDQKALKAVRGWKCRPALNQKKKPVQVVVTAEVNFQST